LAGKKPNKTEKDGRKDNGQFAPGNNFGGSAPYSKQKREERELIDAMLAEAVPPARMARIADKLATLAEEGNVEAAKFIFDRRLGKVAQPVEVGGADGAAFEIVVSERKAKN
jgi:hypothetical protein